MKLIDLTAPFQIVLTLWVFYAFIVFFWGKDDDHV